MTIGFSDEFESGTAQNDDSFQDEDSIQGNDQEDQPVSQETHSFGQSEQGTTDRAYDSDNLDDVDDDWGNTAPQTETEEEYKEPTRPKSVVAIDWVELEGALENNSPELHSFLNVVSGDVVRIFEGGENSEIRLKQAETSPDYLYIEPISSRDQYRWMEEFIEIVEDETLKDKLNIAIDGKGAFRRFKDVLVNYADERELWFVKRSEKLRNHLKEWLIGKNVEATNLPPWEGGEPMEERPGKEPTRRFRQDYDSGHSQSSWRDGEDDLRNLAHEMLDLVPSRELPTAVSFLEFLRSRRGGHRRRY